MDREIALFDHIAAGPDNAAGRDLAVNLFIKLDVPFHAVLVDYLDLRIGAGQVLFIEFERRFWLTIFTADPQREVEFGKIAPIFPEDRAAGLCRSVGLALTLALLLPFLLPPVFLRKKLT